jgi:uncharacterized protein YndB with AHSA1/START domain
MADIFHNFPIKAPVHEVFAAISTPEGLDSWWSKTCDASPAENAEYKLGFGPGYEWSAIASQWRPDSQFELQLTEADDDWRGTRIGFQLTEKNGVTEVSFQHRGWPEANEHYQISCFCWAMYLRLLKRYVEFAEVVPYEDRLDV